MRKVQIRFSRNVKQVQIYPIRDLVFVCFIYDFINHTFNSPIQFPQQFLRPSCLNQKDPKILSNVLWKVPEKWLSFSPSHVVLNVAVLWGATTFTFSLISLNFGNWRKLEYIFCIRLDLIVTEIFLLYI